VRINPIPFVLTPGILGVGFVVGGTSGAAAALGGWAATLVVATSIVVIRRLSRRDADGHEP